jgi:hypothetical protein
VSNCVRSRKYLEDCGYKVDKCEYWNAFSRKTHDLFGILDLVAIADGITLGVQTTSMGNVAARRKKMRESPFYQALHAAGWKLVLHGWGKKKGRWVCKSEEI